MKNLLNFINQSLPKIDRRDRPRITVSEDTELFESRVIDSLAIVHLIAYIEDVTGEEIHHSRITIENFATPAAIAWAFLSQEAPIES